MQSKTRTKTEDALDPSSRQLDLSKRLGVVSHIWAGEKNSFSKVMATLSSAIYFLALRYINITYKMIGLCKTRLSKASANGDREKDWQN
jgi:hypothetical protein